MPEAPRDGYSVLASFSTKEEADIVASALRASGVPAIVGNAHAAAVAWTMVPAMGGIQVMAPTAMLAEARSVLDAPMAVDPDDGVDPEEAPLDLARPRGRWKARILLAWTLGPIALTIGLVLIQGWIRLAMRLLGSEAPE